MRNWLVNVQDILRFCPRRLEALGDFGCLLAMAIVLSASARGQMPRLGNPPDAPGHTPGLTEPEDESQRQMEKKLEMRRNEERQKQLVRDTKELLALATELKTDVDKTDKNVLSVEVVRKSEEIEKLAKSVKERMRSR